MDAEALKSFIRDVPDFPKPGILFKDVTPLLLSPEALQGATEALIAPFRELRVDRILGIESRGFLFGAPAALAIGAGLALVRKKGKLPWRTRSASYALEYGEDTVEIHEDAVQPGQRVLVLDDVVATGGTAAATVELARACGGEVVGCSFLIEIAALDGIAKLDVPQVHAVLRF